MDIEEVIRDAMKKAIETAGQRLLEQACQMEPIHADDFLDSLHYSYAAFTEYGKQANVIDSTAIVIDESIPALPAPKE
jgi:hypothetical protein